MAQLITISTGKNNDIYLNGLNNLAMSEDAQGLANVVLNRTQTATGELQYDLSAGIPYFTTVFSDSPDLQMYEAFMRQDALSTPGVERVTAFSIDVSNNILTYKINLSTVFGEVTVNA